MSILLNFDNNLNAPTRRAILWEEKMKGLMLAMIMVISGSSMAAQYERIVPCTIFDQDVERGVQGVSSRKLAKACSLYNASKHGSAVCKSDSFAWLRQAGETELVSAEYLGTDCRSAGGFKGTTCETHILVECK